MGLHFSAGSLLGSETFVRQEVAKLRAAQYQYELAQQELTGATEVRLGSGCDISDRYSLTEWFLVAANGGRFIRRAMRPYQSSCCLMFAT